jgi:hypothetical protein
MATQAGKSFEGTQVELDGEQYTNCTFTDCVFVYKGTSRVVLDKCTIDPSCRFLPQAEAANTMVTLSGLLKTPLRGHLLSSLGLHLSQ